ncbi:alkaline shock response membrane anchor protein AmaP [Actinomadura sp. GC306]|uniref:DUF6286 domain-containing protein n=1 Tax=Actinomadura sp. GC306 TaxID=2530367 RepID=UPI001043256A|nr:DUF6286 domain-containing protein [Actinomadura sp. GC306]TDC68295.1 alkaline shock response membrane anchor protein AmaP [Actinomadura sp. GC306]
MAETLVRDLIEDEHNRRQARRLAVREFRPRRGFAGFAAALLVTTACGVAAVELLAAALGSGVHPVPGVDVLADALRRRTWHDALPVAGAITFTGAGFLLAALPGRLRGVPLAGSDPRQAGALGRTALRRTLADAALAVPGIERARVRGPRPFRGVLVVRVTTGYRNPANLADLVRAAVEARLDRIEPMHRPRVDVRLGWRRD